MLHSDTNHLIRVGGLIFLSPGHLLPHQLHAFHTPDYIYPIGYKIVSTMLLSRRVQNEKDYELTTLTRKLSKLIEFQSTIYSGVSWYDIIIPALWCNRCGSTGRCSAPTAAAATCAGSRRRRAGRASTCARRTTRCRSSARPRRAPPGPR